MANRSSYYIIVEPLNPTDIDPLTNLDHVLLQRDSLQRKKVPLVSLQQYPICDKNPWAESRCEGRALNLFRTNLFRTKHHSSELLYNSEKFNGSEL